MFSLNERTPSYFRVMITKACNLSCPFCHKEGARKKQNFMGSISTEELSGMLKVAFYAGVRKFKFLGGEPLLRKDLPEIINQLRKESPTIDISLITSGAADPEMLRKCFASGLDRANMSIHGWDLERFKYNGGNERLFRYRQKNLEILLKLGRPLKLNYVYTGKEVEADLKALLDWACDKPLTVNVLDQLDNPSMSHSTVREALIKLCGPVKKETVDEDPDSLPTKLLEWASGLQVELKTSQLRDLSPWRSCNKCPAKDKCKEGIFAIRLAQNGDLRLCMDREDLKISLINSYRESHEKALSVWQNFIANMSSTQKKNAVIPILQDFPDIQRIGVPGDQFNSPVFLQDFHKRRMLPSSKGVCTVPQNLH